MDLILKHFSKEIFSLIAAFMITDGFIEQTEGNPRVHISFTVNTPLLFNYCCKLFDGFIEAEPRKVPKTNPYNDNITLQYYVRSINHPVFNEIYNLFYFEVDGVYKKLMPPVSFLIEHLSNNTALGLILLCDGSRKDAKNRGYEIHVQNVNFEGCVRLSLFLYEAFGIRSWPAYDAYPQKGVAYWNVYIAATSVTNWFPRVESLFLECGMYDQKVPSLVESKVKRTKEAKFDAFYDMFSQNIEIRENVYYQAPLKLVNSWRAIQQKR